MSEDKQTIEQTKTPATTPPKKGFLSSLYNSANYLWENRTEPSAIAIAGLLGTTALVSPVLATWYGALGVGALSCYLLAKTSDIVVDNTSSLGKKFGIPALGLGLILGAITSMPELAVSVGALMSGSPDIGFGNIIGSNIANVLLILGISAAITPLAAKGMSWKFNTTAMMGATAAFGGLLMAGMLPGMTVAGLGLAGVGLVASLGAYAWGNVRAMKKDPVENHDEEHSTLDKLPGAFNALWGLAGVGGLVFSADLLVSSASSFAQIAGVPAALVGALAVAIGTSLPELAVNIRSIMSGKTDMAIGNVLGSNIFNILMVGGALGLAGAAVPAAFSPSTWTGILNLGAFGGATALLGGALYAGKGHLKQWQGWTALSLYGAFTAASIGLNGASMAVTGGIAAVVPAAFVVSKIPFSKIPGVNKLTALFNSGKEAEKPELKETVVEEEKPAAEATKSGPGATAPQL